MIVEFSYQIHIYYIFFFNFVHCLKNIFLKRSLNISRFSLLFVLFFKIFKRIFFYIFRKSVRPNFSFISICEAHFSLNYRHFYQDPQL